VSDAISGHITAFFLFDVAEAVDLGRVQRELGAGVAARLAPKPTTPPYVQYRQPPITIDGQAVETPRLGLDQWKGSVQEKLRTPADIYRFAVEQTSMARGEFLEIIVVLILVLELVLLLAGSLRLWLRRAVAPAV
jgi:hypothetical protein